MYYPLNIKCIIPIMLTQQSMTKSTRCSTSSFLNYCTIEKWIVCSSCKYNKIYCGTRYINLTRYGTNACDQHFFNNFQKILSLHQSYVSFTTNILSVDDRATCFP